MAAFGSVVLNKEGNWLVAVQCSLTMTGFFPGSSPYFTLVSGTHGSFTLLPTVPPADPLLWAWSFIHTVTSSPETLSFTGDAQNLGSLTLDAIATYKAIFMVADDGTAPDADSVTVNPGSKLTILRGTNR